MVKQTYIRALLLLCSLLSIQYQLSAQKLSIADSTSLRRLWLSLDGPNWQYPVGTPSGQMWFKEPSASSYWQGVTVANGSVTSLDLANYMVPASGIVQYAKMKPLAQLTDLQIKYNTKVKYFQADSIIAYLSGLTSLNFSSNNAQGVLPGKLFSSMSKLTSLNLSNNRLTDTLPYNAIGNSVNLIELRLGGNEFVGVFDAYAINMGAAITSSPSKSLDVSHNKLTKIVSSRAFSSSLPLILNLNNNQITTEDGFVQKLYSKPGLLNELSTVNIDFNQLPNSTIASSLSFTNSYYQGPNGYTTVVPQVLGAKIIRDVPSADITADLNIATLVKDDSYSDNTLAYYVNGLAYFSGEISYSKNAQGFATFTFKSSFLQNYLSLADSVSILPYVTAMPSSGQPYYSVQFSPIVLRRFDKPKFRLMGNNPFICKSSADKNFYYGIDALGVQETDNCTVQIARTDVTNGVRTNTVFDLSTAQVTTLLREKHIDLSLLVTGDSLILKLNKVVLNGTAAVTKDSSNYTTVSYPNANNKTRIIPQAKFYCKSANDKYYVKIVNPQLGVNYDVTNLDRYNLAYIFLAPDTLMIQSNPIFGDLDGKFELKVLASVGNDCQTVLYKDSIEIRSGNVSLPIQYKYTPPTCSSDALISLPVTDSSYVYVPMVLETGLSKYQKFGDKLGGTVDITVPIFELERGASLNLLVKDKYCLSTNVQSIAEVSFDDTLKLKKEDSLAVVNFVERIGNLPNPNNDYLWYGNVIYDLDAQTYLPLNAWKNSSGGYSLVTVVCGRVAGLYLNGESAPIGVDKPFNLAFDTLSELRNLDIAYNKFIGSFDAQKPLSSSKLNIVDISHNNFTDTSFVNFKGALLKASSFRATANKMTFKSLLNVHLGGDDSKLMPQQDIYMDTTITINEGDDLVFLNKFPDTKDGKLSYKWYQLVNQVPQLVATTRNLKLTGAKRDQTGSYYCVIFHPDFQARLFRQPIGYTTDSMKVQGLYVDVRICDASAKDSLALVTFYEGLKIKPKWDLNKPVKTWAGVTFDCANVVGLNLKNQGLAGTVTGLDNLYYLQRVDLSNNALDSISFALGNFNYEVIKSINLAHNNITDYKNQSFVPRFQAGALDTLILAHNNFKGAFSFENFVPTYLDLSNNRMKSFEMYYNPFAGTERLGNKRSKLQSNERILFEGFYDFKTKYLNISNNQLSNNSLQLVDSLKSIKHLDVSRNQLYGPFPNLKAFVDSLQYLNASYNTFSGELPGLDYLPRLDTLILAHNYLSGSVNTLNSWKVPGKPLKYIDLGNNSFFGAVSDSFALLQNLQYLALDSNVYNFDESQPGQKISYIPKLSKLKALHVENNSLDFGHLKGYASLGSALRWFPQDSLMVNAPERAFGQDSSYKYDVGIANESDPLQKYTWYRIKLDGTQERLANDSAKLILNKVQKSDIGSYYAVVRYPSLGADSLITQRFFVNVTYCKLNIKDSLAMLHLYRNTKMKMPASFKASDISTWPGVKVDCEYITEIRLPNKSLTGFLSGLDSLDYLEVLDLSDNQIKTASLDLRQFIGKLRVVKLRNNGMSFVQGLYINLPVDVKDLGDTLDMSGNNLQQLHMYGILPKYVDISKDSIEYLDIQIQLGTPHTLIHFNASHNSIKGQLTNSLNQLLDTMITSTQLKHLDLSYNAIEGGFSLPRVLPKLEYLDVSHNAMYYIGFASKLKYCTALNYLNVGNNKIYGAFNDTLTKLTQLQYCALDSNNVDSTEYNSGFTSLPLLPLNTGLQLYVQDNHLDYTDLEPYTALFNKNPNKYYPQYDSVDVVSTYKPAGGSAISLTTTLAGSKTTYSWTKYKKPLGYLDLNIATSKENVLKFTFTLADTGKYSVTINNTDFPGLTFYRRPITLLPCGVAYVMKYKYKASQTSCTGQDSLSFTLVYGGNNRPVTNYYSYWYFNSNQISGAYNSKIPLFVSGAYNYTVNDNATGCVVISSDTLINTKAHNSPSINFTEADSSLHCANIYPVGQEPKYQWFINGLAIAGAHAKSLRVYYNGNYQLLTSTSDSCTANSREILITEFSKTFVREEHSLNSNGQVVLSSAGQLQIFPNPAKDQFTLSGLIPGSIVVMRNLQGDILWQNTVSSSILSVPAVDLPKGLYLLNIAYQHSSEWRKVVLE